MEPILQKRISQVNREMGRSFEFFRRFYFQSYHKHPDSAFHKEMTGFLTDISVRRGQKFAIAAPRSSAKSTLITLEYVLYSICYRLDPFIVIFSSTTEQAERYLSDIKRELESNPRLIEDFPDICEIGRKPGPPRWCKSEIETRNKVKVLTQSPGRQARGMRYREVRPSLIILDDVETDEKIQSVEQYDKITDWFTKTVLKLGSAETNIILTGTIHHYNSLLAQYANEKINPGWIKRIYRSVISWAIRTELWEKWTKIYNNHEKFNEKNGPEGAKEYFETNRDAMLENTKVLWPESKSYYDLMVMRENDGTASFDSEMQNEPVNPRDCYFNPDEFHYWDDAYSCEEDLLQAIGEHAEFYGACDPSLGRQGKRGDYSAIITLLRDSRNGNLYVLDADIERRKPDATIDHILALHQRRSYQRFAIESNQFQEFMASELEKRGKERGLYPPVEKIVSTSDKLGRIQTLEPIVKNGAIKFSRRHITLLEQMRYFPKGNHDDGPDALEMVFQLCKGSDRVGITYWVWDGPWPGDGHWVSI